MKPTETVQAMCLLCGRRTWFDSFEPATQPCKRNTFLCRRCGSMARNRHLAKILLEKFSTRPPSSNLRQFADRTERAILNTDSTGALHKILRKSRNYIVSEYAPGVASGTRIRGGLYQDLEHTSFPDRSFDLVITEDVLEHVADPVQACREIKRILRPGGSQVATISVLESQPHSVVRSRRENGSIIHLLPPVYHSDPLRPEGALVFVDFGADVIDRYFSLTGKTEVFWSYRNAEDEQKYAIYHNAVYLSRKT